MKQKFDMDKFNEHLKQFNDPKKVREFDEKLWTLTNSHIFMSPNVGQVMTLLMLIHFILGEDLATMSGKKIVYDQQQENGKMHVIGEALRVIQECMDAEHERKESSEMSDAP